MSIASLTRILDMYCQLLVLNRISIYQLFIVENRFPHVMAPLMYVHFILAGSEADKSLT